MTPPVPAPSATLTLEELGEPVLAFVVVGTPGPQGSKTAFRPKGGGKVIVKESSEKVRPWRTNVALAALEATGAGFKTLDGPLVLDMVFSLRPPAARPKSRVLPSTTPDLSKLARSTEDALGTDTRILADDARIVGYRSLAKVYAGDTHFPDALPHAGAVVRIWRHPVTLLPATGGGAGR